jgi:signal transduction histidine kinase
VTRRILVGLLALAALLLGGAVLPLGLETAAHYRVDFADATLAQARALASVAEERLSDQQASRPLRHDLGRYVGGDQGVVLLDAAGTTVVRAGLRFTVPARFGVSANPVSSTVETSSEMLSVAAVPVGEGQSKVGVLVLARPTEPLEVRIRSLWLTLAGAAAASLLAAVGIAIGLSRWVTRPLRRLEEATHAAGAGNLQVGAGTAKGPPEVRRLAAAFDAMTSRLNTLLDGHRAVIADVSHQLRTPMSALRLRLELLPDQEPPDRAELSGALDEVNRLSRLIDGLLAVARADTIRQAPTPIEVRSVVSERVTAWSPLAAERGVNLDLIPGPPVLAWAVPDHLEQILDNLLGNCFDLEPPPGHVSLNVTGKSDDVTVSVADDGPGMSLEQRENAFRRFATGHADTGGTGLGLAIVQRLIVAAGGRITLTETSGGGLTVVFSLARVLDTRRG